MASQPYVGGITDTVPHRIAATLTRPDHAAKTRSASGVVRTDRWFPGPAAVATSRDGHVLAGAAQSIDACTGEVTVSGPRICPVTGAKRSAGRVGELIGYAGARPSSRTSPPSARSSPASACPPTGSTSTRA